MKQKKILEINLQSNIEEIKKAFEFDTKHNHEYILVDDCNMIDYKLLAYLLRVGYQLNCYADYVELRHKNYNYENEQVNIENK